MINLQKIAVVVPAFNEEKLIALTLSTIPDFVDFIFVINDASQDNTSNEIERASQKDSRIVQIQNGINLGVGASIAKGYQAALTKGANICVVMDGDGQMPPEYLSDLLHPLLSNQAEVAKGNRFFSFSSFRSMPSHRILGNIVLSIANKIGSGYWKIIDPQNGYIASKSDVIKKIDFGKLTGGYDFQNAYLCQLRLLNVRLVDVNIPAKYGDETSTMPIFRVTFNIILTLAKNFLKRVLKMKVGILSIFVILGYLAGFVLAVFDVVTTLINSESGGNSVGFVAIGLISLAVLIEILSERFIAYRNTLN